MILLKFNWAPSSTLFEIGGFGIHIYSLMFIVAFVLGLRIYKKIFTKEKVEAVLIGEPKQMNGQPSESASMIKGFVTHFTNHFPEMKVIRVDERFTSKMAFQSMIDTKLSKKHRQNKALIDEISATIMLQDYLSSKRF